MSGARRVEQVVEPPPRRVLVIGATTPLGRAVCRALCARPQIERLIAVGIEAPHALDLPFCGARGFTYVQADLAGDRRTRTLLFGPARHAGVEVLIHLAQHRHVPMDARRAHALHVQSVRSALDALERHPSLRRVVLRSFSDVYRVEPHLPTIVDEHHPLLLGREVPGWLRARVEADVEASTRIGASEREIVVLRCAEVLAAGTGSQLYDYLRAPVCLRPLGFDPMMNLLSLEDFAEALVRAALARRARGVFNVPGADTLPISACIRLAGRPELPLPGPLVDRFYALRRRLIAHADFSYRVNEQRFHYPAVLDGTRARALLGYRPRFPLRWPPGA